MLPHISPVDHSLPVSLPSKNPICITRCIGLYVKFQQKSTLEGSVQKEQLRRASVNVSGLLVLLIDQFSFAFITLKPVQPM